MNLFTGTLETIEGPVRCVGTYSGETGGGVFLSPRFRLEGFFTFKIIVAQIEGPTLCLDVRVTSIQTTSRGNGYLMKYVVLGGPGDD